MNVQFLMKSKSEKVASRVFNRRLFDVERMDLVLHIIYDLEDIDVYINVSKFHPETIERQLDRAISFVCACRKIEEEDTGWNMYRFIQYNLHNKFLEDVQFIDSYDSEEVEDLASWAQEMCEDCGDIPSDLPWYIADHIDWNMVAKDLLSDYDWCVMEDGTHLLVRAA